MPNTKAYLKLLREARKLIEAGWCQGSYAAKAGKACSAFDKDATHFDLLGAITKAANKKIAVGMDLWDYFPEQVAKNPGKYNDHKKRTQAEILRAIDHAIERLENDSDD